MSFLYGSIRTARISPEMVDEKVARVVNGLRGRGFLKGTVFETRAVEMGLDPYSVLAGILVGVAATIVVGMLTIELWLPRAIARLTGRTLTETSRTVTEILAGA